MAAAPARGGRKIRERRAWRSAALDQARVTVTVRRGERVVKRYRAATRAPERTHRLRFAQWNRPRGDYEVTVRATRNGRSQSRTLTSRKL